MSGWIAALVYYALAVLFCCAANYAKNKGRATMSTLVSVVMILLVPGLLIYALSTVLG